MEKKIKRKSSFQSYFMGVTTGISIFFIELVVLIYLISNRNEFRLDQSVIMVIVMSLGGLMPIALQKLAYRYNNKFFTWTPIAFVVASVLDVFLAAFCYGTGNTEFMLTSIATIPFSIILIFFSMANVSLMGTKTESVYNKTNGTLLALWTLLWIVIGIVI